MGCFPYMATAAAHGTRGVAVLPGTMLWKPRACMPPRPRLCFLIPVVWPFGPLSATTSPAACIVDTTTVVVSEDEAVSTSSLGLEGASERLSKCARQEFEPPFFSTQQGSFALLSPGRRNEEPVTTTGQCPVPRTLNQSRTSRGFACFDTLCPEPCQLSFARPRAIHSIDVHICLASFQMRVGPEGISLVPFRGGRHVGVTPSFKQYFSSLQ